MIPGIGLVVALVRMNVRQILLGILALTIGAIFYLLNRPPDEVYLIPDEISLYTQGQQLSGFFGNNLPNFIHTFAFILLTTGILGCRGMKIGIFISLGWLFIDILLELGQNGQINRVFVDQIPQWFDSYPILENVKPYLINGQFEVLDLVASVLGSAFAYIIYIKTIEARREP